MNNPQVIHIETKSAVIQTETKAEKQLENTQDKPWLWKPGQSGNPNGRPRRTWTWKELLEEVGEELIRTKTGNRHQWKKIIAQKLYHKASEGDVFAIRELMNRMDGMPTQKQELTGKNGEPLLPIPILGGHHDKKDK